MKSSFNSYKCSTTALKFRKLARIQVFANFDFAIAIRMIIKDKLTNVLKLQSGAGIVNLSIPENEYAECLTKLRAFLNVMGVHEHDIANR